MMDLDQGSNPYLGLRPFDREDSIHFFGRREQTAELLERLHETHFLAVLGSSGSGKSSLIRAGLIPALLGGFLVEERDRWRIAVMKPGDAPLRNLAAALCADNGSEGEDADVAALEEAIVEGHTQALIDRLTPKLGADTNLLLLVDQFEEIFAFRGVAETEGLTRLGPALSGDQARRRVEAAEFVDLIVELSERADLPIYTTLTMRTDFLGECDLFYGLPEAMNRGRYLVPRLTRQQLAEAIEGPALLSMAQIAPRLHDRLLNRLGDRSDRLPVLQHALLRTWEFWRRGGRAGPIDLEHFEAAGTLSQALSMHADEALREEDAEATARIFRCLTDTDPGMRRVRRAASLSELMSVSGLDRPAVEAILERFSGGGRHFVYLSPGGRPDDPRVELCHESLIRRWDRLSAWVDQERESRDRFVELVIGGRREAVGKAALLRDPALQIALDWRRSARPTAAWARRYIRREDDFEVAMDYLDRSQDAAERHERRKRRMRQWAYGLVAAFMVTLMGLTYWAYTSKLAADASKQEAERNARKARDAARLAMASEWLDKDPTQAALVLLELEQPDKRPYAAQRMYQALGQRLAELELEGHSDRVLAAAVSPDGLRVVTASSDGTARIWETTSGAQLASLPHALVTVASFSPDGARLVTASRDGTVYIWDADYQPDLPLEGHLMQVSAAQFSFDGTRVVTASWDGTARIWDAESGKELAVLRRPEREGQDVPILDAASFSRDGTRVVTASNDGTARIWNTDSGALIATLEGHDEKISATSFSPDGARVVTASIDGTAGVWDARSGVPLAKLAHAGSVRSAAFSPDGSRIVTASDDKTARIWDAGSGQEIAPLEGHTEALTAASFSPDGTRVLTASKDRTARIWDTDSAREIARLLGHQDLVSAASFFGPGAVRVVTASWDKTARIWSPAAGVEAGLPIVHAKGVLAASFSPDGARIVTASRDGTARIRDLASGVEIPLEGHRLAVSTAAFSGDGSRVVTASDDTTARVWEAATGEVRAVLEEHTKPVRSAEFSPDASRVVTASKDGTARIWNAESGASLLTLGENKKWINMAAFSPDGSLVVTASDDDTARIWEAATGKERFELLHEDDVRTAWFSPDGRQVVTASGREAWIWEAASGKELRKLAGHAEQVNTAAFSQDGSRIVTASEDRTARVWNASSGEEVAKLVGHGEAVYSAKLSGDGSWVITASDDATARIWDVASDVEVARLRHEEPVFSASFSPDGLRVLTASDDATARIWWGPGKRLRALIRERTSLCLDPAFGDAREDAEQSYQDCQRCLAAFESAHSGATSADVAALEAYEQCLRDARR